MALMDKGRSCGACHNGKDTFKTDDCTKCHPVKEVEFKLKDAGDVKFSHEFHMGLYKCGDCHVKLYLPSAKNKRITMAEMEAGKILRRLSHREQRGLHRKGELRPLPQDVTGIFVRF